MILTVGTAGRLVAACIAAFSAFVAFALVADNGTLIFARRPGVLALLAFAGTATLAAIVAIRGPRTFTPVRRT